MIAGRYRLEREIGRGGSGTVHLAVDEVLGRQVAIKRIGMIAGSDDVERERAEREARLAAALNHPHVVSVFDLVDEADVRWLVMEYVDGQTLNERVRSTGALEAAEAAALIGQTADALVEAHAHGIVHRDVKPSNILISHGNAKLNDFGIARSADDASLTQTGLVTGSPAYLAPEVASGSSATPASDVWSLGATLFHAVTGAPPYEVGDNLLGALYKIVHEDPPRLPDDHPMAGLLTVMMTHDPEQRWSMRQVRDELGRIARGGRSSVAAGAPVPARAVEQEPTGVLPAVRALAPPPGGTADAAALGLDRRRGGGGRGRDRGGVRPGRAWDPGGERRRPVRVVADEQHRGADRRRHDGAVREEVSQQMDAFITSYLSTVTTDPRAAFDQLTPGFQETSGGYDGYICWWSKVQSARAREHRQQPVGPHGGATPSTTG